MKNMGFDVEKIRKEANKKSKRRLFKIKRKTRAEITALNMTEVREESEDSIESKNTFSDKV